MCVVFLVNTSRHHHPTHLNPPVPPTPHHTAPALTIMMEQDHELVEEDEKTAEDDANYAAVAMAIDPPPPPAPAPQPAAVAAAAAAAMEGEGEGEGGQGQQVLVQPVAPNVS